MAVTKKPSIDQMDAFIGGAEGTERDKTQKRDTVKPLKRKTVVTAKRESVASVKKTKMTFYMSPEMYLKWKTYELDQLQQGNKVSFQGVIEKYLNKLL